MNQICSNLSDKPHRDVPNEGSIIIACKHCDLVQLVKKIEYGSNARCQRCKSILLKKKKETITRTFALVITGLILFFPACLCPIITLKILGETTTSNLFSGIIQLFKGGYPEIALAVLFFNIIIPFLKLISLFYVIISLKFRLSLPFSIDFFKVYTKLDLWAMQEVFLMGILVALTKLDSIASVKIGTGFYIFCILIIITTSVSSVIDTHEIWEKLENSS